MFKYCCAFIRGELYASKRGNGYSWGYNWGYSWGVAPDLTYSGRFLGNVRNLTLTFNSSTKEQVQYDGNFFNTDCALTQIDSVDVSLTLLCANNENLAQALYGNYSTMPLGADVVDKIVFSDDNGFLEGSFISFDEIGVDTSTIVVKKSDDLTVLVEGVDYQAFSTGIKILNGLSYSSGVGLLLSYSFSSTYDVVEALTKVSEPLSLTFNGVNLANTNEKVLIKLYKVRLLPAKQLPLISDEFIELELTGRLEPDPLIKNSSGVSKFLKIMRTQQE